MYKRTALCTTTILLDVDMCTGTMAGLRKHIFLVYSYRPSTDDVIAEDFALCTQPSYVKDYKNSGI